MWPAAACRDRISRPWPRATRCKPSFRSTALRADAAAMRGARSDADGPTHLAKLFECVSAQMPRTRIDFERWADSELSLESRYGRPQGCSGSVPKDARVIVCMIVAPPLGSPRVPPPCRHVGVHECSSVAIGEVTEDYCEDDTAESFVIGGERAIYLLRRAPNL